MRAYRTGDGKVLGKAVLSVPTARARGADRE